MSCGCSNGKVKFSESPQFVVNPPKRRISTSCDSFGKCGRIETNLFNVSEGGTVSFARTNNALPTNFPKDQFNVSVGTTAMSSIGLRQAAEEFAAMADELDGLSHQSTKLVTAVSHKKHSKRRKTSHKHKKTSKRAA